MSMKAMLGTVLALVLAIGGTAYIVSRTARTPEPPPKVADYTKGEIVYENPFDLKGPGPHPKVVVPESSFDFGVMALGGEQSRVFEFRNEGQAPLRLAKGHILCKCTIPTLETGEIPPDQSTKITLTWKPTTAQADFAKTADIWTNDPANPKITLSVKGNVFSDPQAIPDSFDLGQLDWNQEAHAHTILYSPTSTDLEITGYEASDPKSFELKWTKLTPEELAAKTEGKTPKPLVGYDLDLVSKPTGTIGNFQGWVKLKVNRHEGEKTINIVGGRTGVIHLYGPDFQAALSLLDLRRFRSDQGGKSTMFMRFDSIDGELQIVKQESASGNLTASLTKEPSTGKKDFYKLTIEAKKGVASGTTFSLENPDMFTLTTNHPQIPMLIFKVRYVVQ